MSIATEISRLQSAKASIKSAIEGKGVTVPSATLLDGYAALISSIPSGGGDGLPAWLKDGDTHLWIDIRNTYQLVQDIRIRMIGTIDWGDGTAAQSVNVTTYTTFTHTYSAPGKYRIDLHPTSGTFYLGGSNSSYSVMGLRANRQGVQVCLYQAEIGTSIITALSTFTFYYCYGLVRVYVPSTITTVSASAFAFCYALAEVEFQNSATIATAGTNIFYYDYALQELHGYAPSGPTSMSATFRYCFCIPEITIPATITSISSYAINNCSSLKVIHCKPTTPPTISAAADFAPPTTCVIEVPSASLATYQAANIWSTYASQMVGV